MQFNLSVILAIAMAAAAVAVPTYEGGGKSEFSYDREDTDVKVKDIASNQCAVTQTASCCNAVKVGSEKHNEWSKRYEHFGGREDGDYLECSAKGADSSAGCAQDAQPFCCNATGSKVSALDCTPIDLSVPISGLNGLLSAASVLGKRN